MPEVPLYTVDAFGDGPFTGNPAAVCLFSQPEKRHDKPADDLMQKISGEMNLSETAFVQLLSESDSFKTGSKFGLRWFTPTVEVPLCGHATLASAAVLLNICGNQSEVVEFVTRKSGSLFCKKNGDFISINLPLDQVTPVDTQKKYKDAAEIVACGHEIKALQTSSRLDIPLVRLPDMSRADFEKFQPDFSQLRTLEKGHWMIATVRASADRGFVDRDGQPYDFASRFFACGAGVDEDPVTGAAHTVLAAYWGKELQKDQMYARQCSKRGGDVKLQVSGDRVELCGRAQIVVSGTLSY